MNATTYGKTYALSLPSGNKVRVHRGSILTRARTGQLTSGLVAAVWKTFGEGAGSQPPEKQTPEQIVTMLEIMDACIKVCLVSPSVAADPEAVSEVSVDAEGFTTGTVNIRDSPDADKALIFGFFQQAVDSDDETEVTKQADLARFRGEPGGEGAGTGGDAVRDPAEPAPAVVG